MNKISQKRLEWACRRGMLELDVLLGNFLREAYPGLSGDDQELFVLLLEENDQDLFLWLTGKEANENLDMNKMIEMVRAHAKNRHSA